MKKGNLLEGIIFAFGGFILLCVALFTDNALSSWFVGFSAVFICSGIVGIFKYFYWSAPKNKERYKQKIENEKIDLHDELKIKLRDRSGRYAYMIGLLTASVSIMIFSVLGQLGIVEDTRLIVLYLGGYIIFQFVIGIVIFNQLLKKYE